MKLALICTLMSSICHILIGTYTQDTGSEGIYILDFDQESGKYKIVSSTKAGNPSFIIYSQDRSHSYAVSEFNDGRQGIYDFKINGSSGKASLAASRSMADGMYADPCNILQVDDQIITSNYTGGTLSGFKIKGNGTPGELYATFDPLKEGLAPEGAVPHMHCAVLSPDGRYIFATDLGSDRIYRFDAGRKFFGKAQVAFSFEDGHPGPRHLTFSPDGRFAYVICELGDMLQSFSYKNGRLKALESHLAYEGQGHGSADIHFSPDGKYLYTSHRLKDDGITIWKVDSRNGKVKRSGFVRTGTHPRNFAITPNGKYLLCACRDSNCINVFQIDARDGSLKHISDISIPAPVCISF